MTPNALALAPDAPMAPNAPLTPSRPSGAATAAEVRAVLPHRRSFLFIDRVLSCDEHEIRALKNVTHTEPFFEGHFPDDPIFPGVLLIEACAQAGGILIARRGRAGRGYLARVNDFKFTGFVVPGDALVLIAECTQSAGPFAKAAVRAEVEGRVVASGTVTYYFR